nr:response regulator [uncultured Desulfobacter sp.]
MISCVVAGLLMAMFIIREREAEEKFSKAFFSSPAWMVISLLETGRILEVNEAFLKATGYKKQEVANLKDYEIGFRKNNDDRQTSVDWTPGNGADKNMEVEIIGKDSKRINAIYSKELLSIGGQKCLLFTALDLREIKRLQASLQQAQKMESIGNLAGGIAHDFNNILVPIIGMSELLIEDLPNDSFEYENALEIYNAGKRAAELVKQILAFSRKGEDQMMPVKLQTVLKEVLRLCRSSIPANIDIQHEIQDDCGSVWANSTQLHQVLMNLITNAYHAVQEKNGLIIVKLKEVTLKTNDRHKYSVPPGKYVMLSVSDNGTGMTLDLKNKIFEPYFTTKEQGKGTGLGLAVAYGIIKECNGDIEVFSIVGKGTTFNIYLPLMGKTVDPGQTDGVDTEPLEGEGHILLVDDEEQIVHLVKRMLERLGYTVTFRLSSIDALDAFKNNPGDFDLVITDMTMPNMTGDILAKKLNEIRQDIPVIICTGFSEKINQEKALPLGINGLLMKPIARAELAKTVRRVLDEAQSG